MFLHNEQNLTLHSKSERSLFIGHHGLCEVTAGEGKTQQQRAAQNLKQQQVSESLGSLGSGVLEGFCAVIGEDSPVQAQVFVCII